MLESRKILSDNMKRLRNENTLTQEDLADRTGLHRTYISDVERCERNISIDCIDKIAEAFGITASELLKEQK